VSDAISKALGALEYAATMLDEDRYPGRITEAIKALQHAGQGEALLEVISSNTMQWAHDDNDLAVIKRLGLRVGDKLYTHPQPAVPELNPTHVSNALKLTFGMNIDPSNPDKYWLDRADRFIEMLSAGKEDK
jgi:hypothetical protein